MPPKIPDHTRKLILDDINSPEELSTRIIANLHGVSEGSVRKIAKDAGIKNAFTRANTEKATRARVTDLAARRAKLAEVLLDDVDRLRERAWGEYTYYERSNKEPIEVTLEQPPLSEARNAFTSLAICIDKHLALVRADQGAGASTVGSLLGTMLDDLVARHGESPASG